MVRQYRSLLKREHSISQSLPGQHVVREYPFNEVSARQARQELLQDIRRRTNALHGQLADALRAGYRDQLSNADADTRSELLVKMTNASINAEIEYLLRPKVRPSTNLR